MRDFKRFFQRRYSAVSTNNVLHGPDLNNLRRKSLQASKSITSNFNILDTFFNKRKNGTRTRSPKIGFLLLALGLLFLTSGILVKIFQPYDLIFKWKLTFSENGEIFNLWAKPPVDLYIKIYLFNITNPDEYMAGTEKMKVEEIGPYVYKELMLHDDIVFNDNNTVSTKPKHPLVWQEHLSKGRKENDTVVMLNIALLSIAQVAAEKSYFYRLPINLLIRNTKSQPLVKMTAREFMFGFETPLTTIGNTFLSDWIYFDKVGLIDRMYDFSSDYETFYTGQSDPSFSGLYASYMGSKNLPQWNGEHCSNIEYASDGAKFKSFIKPNETLKFFRKSMCRPQNLVRASNFTRVNGFDTYKYVFEENALDNGQIDERNKCYCKGGKCQPRGLVDVHECYYGFPISLSYPHFMDADPKIIEDLEGVHPDPEKHSSYFMIEPNSGLPIKLSVKFQINMHFRDISSMAHVDKFSHKTLPMVWFEIAVDQLPESLTNRFNLYLNILPLIDVLGIWIPLFIGIILLLIAIINAIVKIPNFIPSPSYKSTNNDKYSKVNLKSNVYNACEVKLIEMNEKSLMQHRRSSTNKITNDKLIENLNLIQNDQFNSSNNSSNEDDDVAECKIDLKSNDNENNDGRNYLLEDLPALTSDDEWNESNSRSSRCSTSTLDIDGNSDRENDFKDNLLYEKNMNSTKEKSSKTKYENSPSTSKSSNIGETSSLIDDIGNNKFNDNLLYISEDSTYNQSNNLFITEEDLLNKTKSGNGS